MTMEQEKKERIIKFLQDQISQAEFRVQAFIFNEVGRNELPRRDVFAKLNEYINDFIKTHSENRWIMLTGLRGAGKTTLLAQLYYENRQHNAFRLYLSVDQIVQILEVNLYEVLTVYEDLIGKAYERLDKPLLLFLDEVQYEEKWGIFLKSLYDRSKKVFIIATGSAALNLNTNTDILRRATFEQLPPLSFREYSRIKNNKNEIEELSTVLRETIFESSTADKLYKNLLKVENKVRNYWIDIERMEIDRYIKYGSLPFMIAMKNEALIYDQIKKSVDRIINMDVARSGRFSSEIVAKIPAILYAIADSDVISFTKLAEKLDISRPKIIEILDTIEKTEMLIRIYPHGSHFSQANKPSKYLFSSPAFRAMYFNFIGSIKPREEFMGKLLEDLVGMYLMKYLSGRINTSINYDYAEGGADFIVSFGREKIIMEVGRGNKGFGQIKKTAKKIKAKYGLVIANDSLFFSKESNAVRIPLEMFLLT